MKRPVIYVLTAAILLVAACPDCLCQKNKRMQNVPVPAPQEKQKSKGGMMEYIIEGDDTIYVDLLDEAKVYSLMPRQKGKDWRQYYKLVFNFSRTYPYALAGRKMMAQVDSTLEEEDLKKVKRDSYIKDVERELFRKYEKDLRNMTVSQGALLMRLVDRECGMCPYDIIKEYLNGMAAGFWQAVAKIFGADLKRRYDPEGKDALIEDLVRMWEDGEFEPFYFSLFWEEPKKIVLDENLDTTVKSRKSGSTTSNTKRNK